MDDEMPDQIYNQYNVTGYEELTDAWDALQIDVSSTPWLVNL